MIWQGQTCQACLNYKERHYIDYSARKKELEKLCDKFRSPGSNDCIIAVSGGKDSHFLVKTLTEEYGMHPLLVTVTDSFRHTQAGIHNLRNLCNHYAHWMYTIPHDLFKKTTRYAFETVGIPLRFVEIAIYTIPYYLAKVMGIPLVFFGENSAYEYGGTDTDYATANGTINELVKRAWYGFWFPIITKEELGSITPHVYNWPLCLYMSYFYPWSSVTNLEVARTMGFQDLTDSREWQRKGTIEQFEQIDSFGYVAHLWMRYPRMGFQRTTDIVTRRIREGMLTYDEGQELIKKHDHILDPMAMNDFCHTLGYSMEEFWNIVIGAKWNKYFTKEMRMY